MRIEGIVMVKKKATEVGIFSPKITVSKTMTFAAAHKLPGYDGKCCNWHGHEWKVRVTVRNHVNPKTGMVTDFVELKKLMEECIIEVYDHTVLNEKVALPTAENLLIDIWTRLIGRVEGLYEITLWESPNSKASLKVEDMRKVCVEVKTNESE